MSTTSARPTRAIVGAQAAERRGVRGDRAAGRAPPELRPGGATRYLGKTSTVSRAWLAARPPPRSALPMTATGTPAAHLPPAVTGAGGWPAAGLDRRSSHQPPPGGRGVSASVASVGGADVLRRPEADAFAEGDGSGSSAQWRAAILAAIHSEPVHGDRARLYRADLAGGSSLLTIWIAFETEPVGFYGGAAVGPGGRANGPHGWSCSRRSAEMVDLSCSAHPGIRLTTFTRRTAHNVSLPRSASPPEDADAAAVRNTLSSALSSNSRPPSRRDAVAERTDGFSRRTRFDSSGISTGCSCRHFGKRPSRYARAPRAARSHPGVAQRVVVGRAPRSRRHRRRVGGCVPQVAARSEAVPR